MKYTIRTMFETNSSSMHSVVITNNNKESDKYYSGDTWMPEEITFWENDLSFGRAPFECLATMTDKARYAIATYSKNEAKVEEICDIFKELTGCKINIHKQTEDTYRDEEGKIYYHYSVTWVPDGEEEYPVLKSEKNLPKDQQHPLEWKEIEYIPGYVDHQSYGLLDRFFETTGASMKEFLSNGKYIVIIDGDEYCVFDSLLNAEIVNEASIEGVVR